MINDYFDKIFIINLNFRKDRMELMKKSNSLNAVLNASILERNKIRDEE